MKHILDIPEIVYRDISGIRGYIAGKSEAAAQKTASKLLRSIESLPDSPFIGMQLKERFDIETDLRFTIVKPYIILYRVDGDLIRIYRVLDGRSDYLAWIGLKSEESDENGFIN